MNLLSWFDPRGRLSRRAYARLFIGLSLISTAVLCLAITAAIQDRRSAALAIAAGIPVAWLSSLALAVRRLHDRGRTGWWIAVYALIGAVSLLPVDRVYDRYPVAIGLYALATFVFLIWFFVETLGKRGTPGPNRYGPVPPE